MSDIYDEQQEYFIHCLANFHNHRRKVIRVEEFQKALAIASWKEAEMHLRKLQSHGLVRQGKHVIGSSIVEDAFEILPELFQALREIKRPVDNFRRTMEWLHAHTFWSRVILVLIAGSFLINVANQLFDLYCHIAGCEPASPAPK